MSYYSPSWDTTHSPYLLQVAHTSPSGFAGAAQVPAYYPPTNPGAVAYHPTTSPSESYQLPQQYLPATAQFVPPVIQSSFSNPHRPLSDQTHYAQHTYLPTVEQIHGSPQPSRPYREPHHHQPHHHHHHHKSHHRKSRHHHRHHSSSPEPRFKHRGSSRDREHVRSHSTPHSRSRSRTLSMDHPSNSQRYPAVHFSSQSTPSDRLRSRGRSGSRAPPASSSPSFDSRDSPSHHIRSRSHAPTSMVRPEHQRPRHHSHSRSQENPDLEPDFQYSKCTGRKKALCIGINYRGQRHELKGCINDARHLHDYLIRNHGYRSGDIVILTDDSSRPRQLPTRRNIIDAMRWLVGGARKHDSLFFHYSGHGGQQRDLDKDEKDGWDEVIYPLDFQKEGELTDDEMHEIMVAPLPVGCRLTALFDSCHSGTVLDLPYIYSSHGRLKENPFSSHRHPRKRNFADVITWSACRDGGTSADTFADGQAVGAMSHAFAKALVHDPNPTYRDLLRSIRLLLESKYSQRPQLGSSHHIDTSMTFLL